MWTVNFQMFKLDLEKAEEPEIKLPTSNGSSKKQESSRKNIYFCFIDYAKAFDCVDHNSTIASKCSNKVNRCMSFALNLKLEMINLSEEGTLKARER